MPVIEFLDQFDGDDFTVDEELPGEAEPPSRRAPVLAALLVVALVLVALIQGARKHGGDPKPAQPTPTSSRAPVTVKAVSTGDGVLVQDGQYLVTRGHFLVSVRSSNGVNPQAPIDEDTGPVRYQLVGDPAAHLVWVVRDTFVRAFDSRTLAARSAVYLLSGVSGATVLDGALYVATDSGVVLLRARATTFVVADRRRVEHLAADPTRHRVLVVLGDQVGVLGVRATVALPGPGSAIAVADGRVWVATRVELFRIDPQTLLTLGAVAFPDPVDVVTTGRHSLLVRYGRTLGCLDVRHAEIAQSWPQVAGPVGFDGYGTIYSLPAGGVPATLTFGGCPG